VKKSLLDVFRRRAGILGRPDVHRNFAVVTQSCEECDRDLRGVRS
jgi:hypothetical protein